MAEGLEAQLEILTQENAFLKKYLALRKKCEQLQQANEKLVNRLQHVKKLVKRYKRETRFLTGRLDEHNDNYRDAQVPVMWEEDQMFNMLRSPSAYSSQETLDTSAAAKPKTSKKSKINDKLSEESPDRPSSSILSSLQPLFLAHGVGQGSESPSPHGKMKKIKVEKTEEEESPKKPANAFLLFCDQFRPAIQEEYRNENHEEIPHYELTKRLALRWNGLSSTEKKIYYDLFGREKEKYELERQQLAIAEDLATREITPGQQFPEATLAAMHLESDSAVTSLLMKQEPAN